MDLNWQKVRHEEAKKLLQDWATATSLAGALFVSRREYCRGRLGDGDRPPPPPKGNQLRILHFIKNRFDQIPYDGTGWVFLMGDVLAEVRRTSDLRTRSDLSAGGGLGGEEKGSGNIK